jgi:hypothetical protein
VSTTLAFWNAWSVNYGRKGSTLFRKGQLLTMRCDAARHPASASETPQCSSHQTKVSSVLVQMPDKKIRKRDKKCPCCDLGITTVKSRKACCVNCDTTYHFECAIEHGLLEPDAVYVSDMNLETCKCLVL